ncbi:RNA polymerase sigma factor [Symmachiella dynata]|uniref:ECF RNA polymerase sigma factor SigE n=1 Tax=Symmachiella dynata TaxID=2527995 RepID=A0A517ZLS8_9PLAN|nr:RNA polymerase sigma factor [Symmachiella dynata]QDU43434.1 ECF RNA polymerase sigma factor SigE [Symmachiella dynata]
MSDKVTSLSLLDRARADDPEAWREISKLYAPLVYHWCQRAGLQSHDASDTLQNVLTSVSRHINAFEKKKNSGSFRGWLWTITRNEIHLHFRKAKRVPKAIGGSNAAQWMAELPAVESAEFDEPKVPGKLSGLVSRCLDLVETEFQPTTWKAFQLTAIEGWTSEAAAQELGMKPNSVRKAKSRVMHRLRTKFEGLPCDTSFESAIR